MYIVKEVHNVFTNDSYKSLSFYNKNLTIRLINRRTLISFKKSLSIRNNFNVINSHMLKGYARSAALEIYFVGYV